MKLLSVEDYVDFECVGGECPICCCGGRWKISIDDKTAEYYRSVEGDFGEELREGILVENGKSYFKLDCNYDCVFLNENKLCRIYRELGEDKMCFTCKTYPRTFYEIGDIMICYLTNSCPQVTKMIMQKKDPLKVVFDDSGHDIKEINENRDIDWIRFNHVLQAYIAGMDLLQNREISVSNRLYLLLFFVKRFQEQIVNGEDPSDLIGLFSSSEIYTMFLESKPDTGMECASKIHAFMMVFRTLLTNSYDHPMWKKCNDLAKGISENGISDLEALKNAFYRLEELEFQVEMEQLLAYRFFVMFMQGFKHTDYFEIIAYECVLYAALIGYTALTEIEQGDNCSQEDKILFYSLCSRTDHTEEEKQALKSVICDEGYYEMDKLLKLVS